MLGEFGLTWPWESLHVEALAWFDHWLKDLDTGILDGPPSATGYRSPTSGAPRIPGPLRDSLAGADLSAEGYLKESGQTTGSREYLTLVRD